MVGLKYPWHKTCPKINNIKSWAWQSVVVCPTFNDLRSRYVFFPLGFSHTLLPKRTRSIYEKPNVTFGTPVWFSASSLSNWISIAGNYDFRKSRYHCVSGFIRVVITYHIRQTLCPPPIHVCGDGRNYESRCYRHTADELLSRMHFLT